MNTKTLTLWFLFAATVACPAQPRTDPGWFRPRAQAALGLQAAPSQGAVSSSSATLGPQSPQPLGLSGEPSSPVAEVITPQIQALADGLQHNPGLIFDYVHDNIRFVLYFGSKKGAALTLLEKSGNDFDQSALLVALLRAAGCTNVGYQFGWMWVPYDDSSGQGYDLHHWWRLTLTNTNWNYTSNYLWNLSVNCGYPAQFATNSYLLLQRTWVVLTNGSTVYQLDPAFKVSVAVPGLSSLPSALGGTSTSLSNGLWSAAAGTTNANSVSGLNEGSVRSTLTQNTANLLSYIQNNCPNAGVQDILGGWQINSSSYADYSTTNHCPTTDWNGMMPILTWANEPTNMMSTLSISFAGTNYQWFVPQLQGQRLALTYDGSGLAQLWQEDTLLAQHSTGSADTNVVLAVTHPAGGGWNTTSNSFIPNPTNAANQVVTNSYQRTNATYALVYAFDPDWGWLQQRQSKLDAYLQQGLTNGSRQVLSESLNVMGLGWMLQTEGTEQLLAGQLGILPLYYHRLGRMAQESAKGYYVDVFMQMSGEYPSGGADAAHNQLADNHFDLSIFFASGLEHGIIEQLQNTNLVGASTVKMLEIASTNGQAIYLANSNNWSSIQGGLSNYGSVLNQIYSLYISQGYNVLLPANGSNHVAGAGSWAGCGFEARLVTSGQVAESRMIISGGYHGGYASDSTAVVNTPYVEQSGASQPQANGQTPTGTQVPTGVDPVDLADGTFQVENTDLSLGQAEPRGITLTRYYNGTRRYRNPAGMAGGWIHNYMINAATVPAPQAGLGGTTPAQAAPMIAATASAIALYSGASASPKNWLVTALVAKWGVDQLTKGGVSVVLGKDTLQFVQQPTGVYTAPANCTWTLSQANGAYSLQQRHGNAFKFDSLGRLASIVSPYTNASLSLTYNASNWVQKVTDWKNRSFTFNYTGTPQRLTSVSDGTRTVSYGYTNSQQGDLVSVTDPENKTSSYLYDTNHQITATLDALSRLVVSNVYDTQGHVTTQYTQGDTNKMWHLYWNGWFNATVDPAGGARYYWFDGQSRLIAFFDELLDEYATWYDGQNHITWTATPLSEYTQFVFDGNHNVLAAIDCSLGYSNQFVFDGQFNLTASADKRGIWSHFGYNAQFSLTGSTNGAGDWVTYGYNTDGTLQTRTDWAGTNTFGYDSSYGQLNRITYPNGLGSEGFYTSPLGDVLSHTNGRGFVTSFLYNSRRQLTNTVGPTNLTTKVAYDAVGNVQSTADARGFTTTSFWSPTRHQTGTAFPATPQGTPALTNLYDNRDWLSRTLDPLQQATVFTNNLAGQLISLTDPLLRTTGFGYDADGRKTNTTTAAQETTVQQWDADGNLTNWVDPSSHAVRRTFDPNGNVSVVTDRRGKAWTLAFDNANRFHTLCTPPGRYWVSSWATGGYYKSSVDPANWTTYTYYDGRGRRSAVADLMGGWTYAYDGNNNQTNVVENSRTNSWAFDAYDRVSAYRDADGNLVQYHCDGNGNVINVVYPGNRNVSYFFDSLNRLTNVTDWANRQTTLTYDLASRVRSMTRPNGTVRLINYDADGETTNIVELTATGFPITFHTLGWANSGRVAWEFAAPVPLATAPPSRTMNFNDDNSLKTFNGPNVTNDVCGNLTWGPLTNNTFFTYSFDARNRLTGVGGLQYGYDPAGNRTAITNGANVTRLVINPNAKLPQVLMRTRSGVTNYYIYGLGLLYEITETASSTNTLFYHFDYRGSTEALTDKNGNITDQIQYSAYGLTNYRAGTNDTPFLYNGRYGVMTDANGLLYMRARFYNPYICRFINPDPAGFTGGLNFYCYADGNPISNLDPFGLDPAFVPDVGMFSCLSSSQTVQASQTAAPFTLGLVIGATGAGAVGYGAAGLVAVGVPQSVVTGGLFVGGAAGIVATGYSVYNNPSFNNITYNAGALAGGFSVGAVIGSDVASALSPPGYQPSGTFSLSSELSMVWRDSSGNPNPFSMFPAWLSPSTEVGPMSTGPSALGAAGAVTGAGAGVAAGLNSLTGLNLLDWLGSPVSSSPTGKH